MSVIDNLLNWNEPRNYPSWMHEEDSNNFQLLKDRMGPSSTWGDKALDYIAFDSPLALPMKAALGAKNIYNDSKPYIETLMNLNNNINPGARLTTNFIDQFNKWSDNEKQLYKDYMRGPTYTGGNMVDNVNQYSSAFGEAKGANLANAPFLGPTIFKDTPLDKLDYGIGLAQLLAGNTVNSAYQLMQEGGKAVKDQGWKGLINTDWLKNAYADVVEEGRGFREARMADNTPTTTDDLWRIADTVDDANISKPLGQTVDELRPTTDTIIREAQDNISKRQAAEAARQAKIIADQTRMQQGQVSRPTVLPKPVKATPLSGPAGYTKPAASSVSTVPRRRARATRGRTAPVIRQPSRQARNYFGGYQR